MLIQTCWDRCSTPGGGGGARTPAGSDSSAITEWICLWGSACLPVLASSYILLLVRVERTTDLACHLCISSFSGYGGFFMFPWSPWLLSHLTEPMPGPQPIQLARGSLMKRVSYIIPTGVHQSAASQISIYLWCNYATLRVLVAMKLFVVRTQFRYTLFTDKRIKLLCIGALRLLTPCVTHPRTYFQEQLAESRPVRFIYRGSVLEDDHPHTDHNIFGFYVHWN